MGAPVDLNQYLYTNYITYDRLYELTTHAFYKKTNADKANIFIDINSFVSPMFKNYPEFIYRDASTPVVSSLINLAAHLRSFYWTRYKSYVKVYFVWGMNNPIYRTTRLMTGYNAHHIEAFNAKTQMQEVLFKNLELLKQLSPSLPDIYFIDGGNEEVAVAINCLLNYPQRSNIFMGVPNIIYSKDPYTFQVVADHPWTFVFRPKKRWDNNSIVDMSYIVEKKNLFECICIEQQNSLKKISPILQNKSWMIHAAIAMSGLKAREVKGFTHFTKASSILLSEPFDSPINVSMIAHILLEAGKIDITQHNIMTNNEYILSADLGAGTFIHEVDFPKLFEGIVNLIAPEDIKEINNKYFVDYPLDIMTL